MENNLTDFKINLKGQLVVNLPVVLIICISLLFISMFLNFRLAIGISFALGWLYWMQATPKWIKWAHSNGIEVDKIASIGKKGFLIWNKQYVIDVLEGNKKPWI